MYRLILNNGFPTLLSSFIMKILKIGAPKNKYHTDSQNLLETGDTFFIIYYDKVVT